MRKFINCFLLLCVSVCTQTIITSCGEDEPEYGDNFSPGNGDNSENPNDEVSEDMKKLTGIWNGKYDDDIYITIQFNINGTFKMTEQWDDYEAVTSAGWFTLSDKTLIFEYNGDNSVWDNTYGDTFTVSTLTDTKLVLKEKLGDTITFMKN